MSFETFKNLERWIPLIFGALFAFLALAYIPHIAKAISFEKQTRISTVQFILIAVFIAYCVVLTIIAFRSRRRREGELREIERTFGQRDR